MISRKEWNELARRRMLAFREVGGVRERRVYEIFGTGTAAVIQPIGFDQAYREKVVRGAARARSTPGSFQLRLTNELYGIQYGEIPHPWSIEV